MRRENDRLVFPHALDEVAHFVLLVGIEPVGRLVHDQDVRVVDQRLREAGAVLVALGKRVDALVEHALEKTQFDRAVDRLFPRRAPETPQLGREVEESVDRHLGVSGRVFRQIADQAPGRQRVLQHVVPADRDSAGSRRNESGHHAHGGGFARAVRPQETQHLAALDRERDVVHRELRTERLGEIFDFDHASSRNPKGSNSPRDNSLFFIRFND